MSSEPVKNRCPPTCPKVREQLRAALAEAPWLADGIFPRKKKDVDVRLPPDVPRDVRDEPEPVIETTDVRVDHDEKIETDVSFREVEDVVEAKPIQEKRIVEELAIIEEQPVVPTEEITDRDFEKIDLIKKEEPTIIEEPIKEITIDHDVKEVDLIEERELIQEPTIVAEQPTVLTEEITEREVEKVDLDKEKEPIQELAVIREEMADHDEKIDLVEDVELTREPISIEEQPVTPIEKIADRDIKKIDLVEEEIFPEKMEPAKEIPVTDKKLEIIEDEVDQEAAPAEIALERPEEYFEPKRIEDYDTKEEEEEEEALTDYERFIDEEMEESLPGVIAKEIPEEPEMVRKIPKKPAVLRERDDRKRPVRPKEAREIEGPPAREEAREELVISPRAERVVPSKRAPGVVKDACDETCPLVKEQKGEQLAYFQEETSILFVSRKRIIRKLKERQRVVDHYYLTKGFSYFEDVCTCSLACMVYSLGRDPFVRSIFASLTLFAIGLKLCSELDAWEMPSRVS